jgi:hypothetical protein
MGHIMGPSEVAGFHEQCIKCKALDTEIRFAIGDICPADLIPEGELPPIQYVEVSAKQLAGIYQASWFERYHQRQLNELGLT